MTPAASRIRPGSGCSGGEIPNAKPVMNKRTRIYSPWIVLVSDLRRYLGRALDACSANPARVIFFEARIGKSKERRWLLLVSIDATFSQVSAAKATFEAGKAKRVRLADLPTLGERRGRSHG